MKKIIVAGSLNMDIVIKVKQFVKVGETIQGEEYFTAPGGKGANQAIAAARMGAQVIMAGALGKDNYGDVLSNNLKQNNIDTSCIQRVETNTGTAFVTVDSKGSNSIVIIPGANNELSIELVDSALEHVNSGDIALTQLESPPDSVLHFLKKAKEKGATTVLNPSPIANLSLELLKFTDILIVNEIEAQTIAGSSESDSEPEILNKLLESGVSHVVMTIGERGVIATDKSGKIISQATIDVTPVDTTAAGDAFLGGFLAALSENKTFEEALELGTICGSLSTTKFGAQPSLPTKEEVYKHLSV